MSNNNDDEQLPARKMLRIDDGHGNSNIRVACANFDANIDANIDAVSNISDNMNQNSKHYGNFVCGAWISCPEYTYATPIGLNLIPGYHIQIDPKNYEQIFGWPTSSYGNYIGRHK